MPFELANLMPAIEALAEYYAREVLPELDASSLTAWEMIRQTGQEELSRAANRSTIRVLAAPLEDPGRVYAAPPLPASYRTLASDGSAVAPEAHFAIPYALIHVALTEIAYAPADYRTAHDARLLFRREEMEIAPPGSDEAVPVEGPVVDTLRAYRELAWLWEGAAQAASDQPLLAMMDAIILWTHRGTGPGHEALRDDYLLRSVRLLARFEQAGIPLVSFISRPHHREVLHTLLAHLCPRQDLNCTHCPEPADPCRLLQPLQDRHLFGFLKEGERSAIFQPLYRGDPRWRLPPAHALDPRLVFFYLWAGPEIARVELPLWIVERGKLPLVHGILLDQCVRRAEKAPGYPLILSLAHEEAVLTGRDRRAIQRSIEDALMRRHIPIVPSSKAQMKGA